VLVGYAVARARGGRGRVDERLDVAAGRQHEAFLATANLPDETVDALRRRPRR